MYKFEDIFCQYKISSVQMACRTEGQAQKFTQNKSNLVLEPMDFTGAQLRRTLSM